MRYLSGSYLFLIVKITISGFTGLTSGPHILHQFLIFSAFWCKSFKVYGCLAGAVSSISSPYKATSLTVLYSCRISVLIGRLSLEGTSCGIFADTDTYHLIEYDPYNEIICSSAISSTQGMC